MLLGIRRTRRDVDGASESIAGRRVRRSILAADVSARRRPTAVDRARSTPGSPRSRTCSCRWPRAAAPRVADAALHPRGPPLRHGRPRLRGDARGPLRAGDRQRAAARRRRAHAHAARLRLRDRAGRAGVRRPRPARRARQRHGERRTASTSGSSRTCCRRVRDSGASVARPASSAAPAGTGTSRAPRSAGPAATSSASAPWCVDVTERQRAARREREGRARADFLARSGVLLDETLDYEPHAALGGRHRGPRDRRLVRRQHASTGPERCSRSPPPTSTPSQRRLGEELHRRWPPDRDADGGTMRVARSGVTEFVPEITEAMLVAGIPDPEHLALVRKLDLRSIIIAALRAAREDVRDAHARQLRLEPAVRRRRRPARRGARPPGGHRDRQRAALHRAHPHRPHAAGAAAAGAAARDPRRAARRPLPRRRRAQRGRRRLLRRLPALGGRVGDGGRRRLRQGPGGRGRHRARPLHAARRRARRRRAREGAAPPQQRDARAGRQRPVRHRRAGLPVDHRRRRIRVRLSLAGHPPAMVVRRDGAVDSAGTLRRHARARRRPDVPREPAPARPAATSCCSTPTASPRPARATGRSASSASPSCSARSRASRRRRWSTRSRRRSSARTRASRATTSRCSRSGWPPRPRRSRAAGPPWWRLGAWASAARPAASRACRGRRPASASPARSRTPSRTAWR